jgi:hypothetical protein
MGDTCYCGLHSSPLSLKPNVGSSVRSSYAARHLTRVEDDHIADAAGVTIHYPPALPGLGCTLVRSAMSPARGIKGHDMTAVGGSLHRVQLECRRVQRVREQGE